MVSIQEEGEIELASQVEPLHNERLVAGPTRLPRLLGDEAVADHLVGHVARTFRAETPAESGRKLGRRTRGGRTLTWSSDAGWSL